LTTTAVALAGGLRTALPARSKLWLAAVIASLVAFQGLGFRIAQAAVGADGPILLSSAGLVAVLAAILAAWVWQSKRLAGDAALPPAIYVHLLNAGALRAAGTGEAK
jgi:NAD(P)H-quinone oxidoreductase subunit 5